MFKEMVIPENNELKNVIQELLEYCDVKEEDGELGRTSFSEPVSEEEMLLWEEENGIKIPESYKSWLRFTGECTIDGTTASFYSPKNFRTEFVPDDLVIIGEQVGDGEVVCFSKKTGEIVSFFEGSVNFEYGTFNEVLKEVLRMMGKREKSPEGEMSEVDRLKQLRANVEANCDGTDEDKRRMALIRELDEMIKNAMEK